MTKPKMSLIEFAETMWNRKLEPWQKEMLERLEKVEKSNGRLILCWPRNIGKRFTIETLRKYYNESLKRHSQKIEG